MSRAQSRYRQVRVTITEEAGNWITIRVMVKPVNAGWQVKDTVYHHRFRHAVATTHWFNLMALATETVASETLP